MSQRKGVCSKGEKENPYSSIGEEWSKHAQVGHDKTKQEAGNVLVNHCGPELLFEDTVMSLEGLMQRRRSRV